MQEKTILVIDDSATIRRLCDSELSNAGFRVLLAPTAEEGVTAAIEQLPNLIILDHQLPGTTGYEVCLQLLKNPEAAKIPVVASSTLRKKAYAEYIDCDNVVDMLPKPYTPEALIATVESAINTAAMVVQSQCDGSAVPEVIDQMGDSDLSGAFGCFGLREIVDMLNNGSKSGVLEVETERYRVYIYVERGRIQAVTASGVDPAIVVARMPAALSELAPVIKFTVAGRKGAEVDGLVELLDNKVLDPRLLKKLLRLQAAVLLRFCFTDKLSSFRFDQGQPIPKLFQKLPLDGSLLSFLVEGALICDLDELPAYQEEVGFVRRAIRGQNLDRAGLSSRHMRMMNLISQPASVTQLAKQLGWPAEEVRRVLHGFELAELVEQCSVSNATKIFGVVADQDWSQKLDLVIQANPQVVAGKIVRDWMALKMLLRRSRPDVLLVELNHDNASWKKFVEEAGDYLNGIRVIGIQPEGVDATQLENSLRLNSILNPECDNQQILSSMTTGSGGNPAAEENRVMNEETTPGALPTLDTPSESNSHVAIIPEG